MKVSKSVVIVLLLSLLLLSGGSGYWIFYTYRPQIIGPKELHGYQWEHWTIDWTITTHATSYEYRIECNGQVLKLEQAMINSSVSYNISPLLPGVYSYRIIVTDSMNRREDHTIQLHIEQDEDSDQDFLFDHEESWVYSTDPQNNDTDQDGVSDGEEIYQYHTFPTNNDTDIDGVIDGQEIHDYLTNPLVPDSDADGLSDGNEIFTFWTNPLNNDTDNDTTDDFSEIYFFSTDPLLIDPIHPPWDGGNITVRLYFRQNEPRFLPQFLISDDNITIIPRRLYSFLVSQIESGTFYIHALKRLDKIRILVIDAFNSTDAEERVHGNVCAAICEDTLQTILGDTDASLLTQVNRYSMIETDRSWGTGFQYAIDTGIDIISLSQVMNYGQYPYFDLIHRCVNEYGMIFCAGTGNDNRGSLSPSNLTLRYPAVHPDTLTIGGVIMTENEEWVRWNASDQGSNWGRSLITYDGIEIPKAVEFVENCKQRIVYQDYYGVSWAIPRIAGLCGALLTENPCLTPSLLRLVLINSTEQISPSHYLYEDAPWENWLGMWNPEVGYGKPVAVVGLSLAHSLYMSFLSGE